LLLACTNVFVDEDSDGPELLLEPDRDPAAGQFKESLVTDGIPATSSSVK